MRLERGDDASTRIGRARRLQRRGDLGRVMRVVVDDDHARDVAEALKPAIDAAELGKSFPHRVEF